MIHRLRALVLAVLICGAGFAAARPPIVFSASFPYRDLPRDLWAARLVDLKKLGFNTVQVAAPEGAGRELLDVVRLARQLGLRVWIEGGAITPELQPFLLSRGGPILDAAPSKAMAFPADAAAPDPAKYLLALRELFTKNVADLNCTEVIEGRTPGAREAAVNIAGGQRPQAAVLRRHGALLERLSPVLARLRPAGGVRLVATTPQKSDPLLRLGVLAAGKHGPAFVSALNYHEDRTITGSLSTTDPRSGKPLVLRGFQLPARQALLMPVNLPLGVPDVCPTCSSFAPAERLVYATAELLSVALENGVLGMEFVAPAESDLVLELARKPDGPLVAGARLRQFEWDEKTHTLRLKIPAGQAPDFHSRVGLALAAPETSAFLKAPRRLLLGSTARVTGSFSSAQLAARARLLAPPGWRIRPEPHEPLEIDYFVDVPPDLIPGDSAAFSLEIDGKVVHAASAPIAPACELRLEPSEALHPRRDVRFPILPALATVALPAHRTYSVFLRNNYDEIHTFQLAASGEGLRFSPATLEVSAGANLEREIPLEVTPPSQPGVYRWKLETHDGPRRFELPAALAVLPEGQAFAYEYDLDRDGEPELVLENAKLRVVIAPRQGGRIVEFFSKDRRANALAGRGALDAGVPMEARMVAPGRVGLRAGELFRTISLGGQDAFFEVEESGLGADWSITLNPDLESAGARFTLDAAGARVDSEKTRTRVHFPAGSPRRARFAIERADTSRK